jgi:hypothetical protein
MFFAQQEGKDPSPSDWRPPLSTGRDRKSAALGVLAIGDPFPTTLSALQKNDIHVCNERLNTKDANLFEFLPFAAGIIGLYRVLKIGSDYESASPKSGSATPW